MNRLVVTSVLMILLGLQAGAHVPNEDYFFLEIDEDGTVKGRFDVQAADLSKVLKQDLSSAGRAEVFAAVQAAAAEIQDYLGANLSIHADETKLVPQFTEVTMLEEPGLVAEFAQFHFIAALPQIPNVLSFEHDLFYEFDPEHRGVMVLVSNPQEGRYYGEHNVALIFTASDRKQQLVLTATVENLIEPPSFFRKGMRHVTRGGDHVLLLAGFLLAAVVRPTPQGVRPRTGYGKLLGLHVGVVALYVLLQAGVLTLASLNAFSLPRADLKVGLAFLVMLLGLHNLFPLFRGGAPACFLAFGLLHGSSSPLTLGDLLYDLDNLKPENLRGILLSYSLGTLLCLTALTIAGFTVCYLLRKSRLYQALLYQAGSALVLMGGTYLLVNRILER